MSKSTSFDQLTSSQRIAILSGNSLSRTAFYLPKRVSHSAMSAKSIPENSQAP